MSKITVTVNVNFTSLDNLVDYLKSRDDSQKQIDELAAKVVDLTSGLQKSTAGLKTAVNRDAKA